jgi:4-aminobutyrate aminotransferase/(S)-3-amino-2-methylpropionate transaminase
MTDLGSLLPDLPVPPPGPRSRELARRLRAVESRNVTFLADDFPVFWEAARGANVRDADGNVYLDLTAAFGVALSGHADPSVVEAVAAQAARMVHGMGDVHPPVAKLELLEALTGLVGEAMPGWETPRAVLASTGSEAVEIALKTARLASGRGGVVAFEGGYHGLTLGALSATARPYFREPFSDRLPGDVTWLPFPTREEVVPDVLDRVEALLAGGVGSVVVEPVQARGGVRIPGPGFGAGLTDLARRHGAVLIADEIYTGLGRCGAVLASSRMGLEPDVVCLGKVLGGGLPLSACVATAPVMDAWPSSPGEALHTSTFLGHPLACAAGLAMVRRVADGLPDEAEALGRRMMGALQSGLAGNPRVRDVRGLGLLLGVEVEGGEGALAAVEALRRGLLVLPAGDEAQVVELSPPVVLTGEQEEHAVTTLIDVLGSLPGAALP